nr:TolC family protein [Sphingobium chlorophenolicum]
MRNWRARRARWNGLRRCPKPGPSRWRRSRTSAIRSSRRSRRCRLFDFGRVDAEVGHARGAEREAIAQFRNAALRAAEDVERAVVGWRTAKEREALHAEEVRAATAARDAFDRAYRAGHVSLAEVVEAQRRVLQAADALALAQADTARATVAGWRAFGG